MHLLSNISVLLVFSLFQQELSSAEEVGRLEFNKWISKHNKEHYHQDQKEYQKRLNIFQNNAHIVQTHNDAYKQGLTSYAMSLDSPFSDFTDEEFHSLYLMDSQNCSATHTSSGPLRFKHTDLPKSMDWRTKGIITPIKNQKDCGSCWTFSTTGTLEAYTCMHNPYIDCTKWTGLAEQQLLDCASDFDNHGCNGGLPSHAFEYIKYAGGIDTEESYPYHATDEGPCLKTSNNYGAKVAEIYNITSGDEDDLVNAIGLVGPVSVAYDVSPDFRFYSHGVYDSYNSTTNQIMCKFDAMHVNHAVVAVGYGETEATENKESIPFFIIRNSWSTSWGMEGYFWIKRGENLCGISDCASFPIVPTRKHMFENGNKLLDGESTLLARTSPLRKRM